jgi:hypothetical protein
MGAAMTEYWTAPPGDASTEGGVAVNVKPGAGAAPTVSFTLVEAFCSPVLWPVTTIV